MSSGESPGDVIRAKDVGAFDVWGLPSFDPWREPEAEPEPEPVEELPEMEEVPLDEVQPLTLEELESIRQEAYNEGFATGEREGFHSTQLKVRQEAEVALNARVASLERLMSSLLAPLAEQDQQLEKAMVGSSVKRVVVAAIGDLLGTFKGAAMNFILRSVQKQGA